MKKVIVLTVIMAACFLGKGYAADIEVNNKICPVSHEEVGSGGMTPHKITHDGKIYNLCCAMCAKDFMKDPAKYVAIIDAEVAAEVK